MMRKHGVPALLRAKLRSASALALSAALVATPLVPAGHALAAGVSWNVDADGFWDIATNWNPGLPGPSDDVVLDVGGPTFRNITFRFGNETVNSINSQETLIVTSGQLTVMAGMNNAGATRLEGGLLQLNGNSSLASFIQSGGSTLAGTGVVTVSGAGFYDVTFGGSFQSGAGSTIHEGAVVLGSGAGVALDEGRLLEFRGGVSTGTQFSFNLDYTFLPNGGTVRNAAGSTFTDSTVLDSAFVSGWGGGLFENLGTYRKTGPATTTITTAFTSSGLIDIGAGTFALTRSSTLSGAIALASGTTLLFTGLTHNLGGVTLSAPADSLVRVQGGAVNVTGAIPLPSLNVQGGTLDAPDAGSTLANGATITQSGGAVNFGGTAPATLASITQSGGSFTMAAPVTTPVFTLSGGSFIANGDMAITSFSQSGSSTLAGTGVVTVSGAGAYAGTSFQTGAGSTIHEGAVALGNNAYIALDEGRLLEFRGGVTTGTRFSFDLDWTNPLNGGTVRNAAGSTFTDSTVLDSAFVSGWGGGLFENLGTYRKTGPATTTITTAFVNAGLVELQGGTLAANGIENSGTIEGFGKIAAPITNTGSTVKAVGGTLVIESLSGGGDLVIAPGATLDMSPASANSSVNRLIHEGVGLILGSQNLTVRHDYQNTAFGTGDAFDPRANVVGPGLILAADATQALSAAGLTDGEAANPSIFLSVRVGETRTVPVTIANAGTETTLRGAVSSAGAPSYLSVSGGDAYAVAPGGTASVDLTVSGLAAGSLPAGTLMFRNNFDNVANQTLTVSGGAFAPANPLLLADLSFGNVQLGSVQTRTISVTNALIADVPEGYQEGLRVVFGAVSAGFTGAGLVDNLAAGLTDAATLVVTLDTSAAGARSGTVQVLLASNGAGTSGLGLLDLGSVTFEATAQVEGAVFRPAQAAVEPLLVDFGNRRVGDPAPAPVALTITNTAAADGFSERLDAGIGTTTGRATGMSSISLLDPQTSSTAIMVGVDTSAAGPNGTVELLFASNGAGTSGLGISPLPSQTFTLEGAVYRPGSFSTTAPATPLVARVGDVIGTSFTIANTAVADGYSEGVGFNGSVSGNGVTFGPVSGLVLAGASTTVSATVDTSTAGAKSGTLGLAFTSDGTGTSGLAPIAIGSKEVTVDATVYRLASFSVTPGEATLTARVGDVLGTAITIANTATSDGFSEQLGVAGTGSGAGVTFGPVASLIAAGASTTVSATVDTSTAGAKSGTLALAFTSDGTDTSGLAPVSLGNASSTLTAQVYAPAVAQFGATTLDFGVVRKGEVVAPRTVTLTNAATGELTDSLLISGSATPPGFAIVSAPGVLEGGASGTLDVAIDTSVAGTLGGDLGLGFLSRNPVLGDLALGFRTISVSGTVNNLAAPAFTRDGGALPFDSELGGYVFDFGTFTQGGEAGIGGFGLGNLVLGPADNLSGQVTDVSGGIFSIAGGGPFDIGLLAAGQISGPFAIVANLGLPGTFLGQLSFAGLGTNASDPLGLATSTLLFLRAQVLGAGATVDVWWDGDGAGNANNGLVDGGNGVLTRTSNNLTTETGATNNALPAEPANIIFAGSPGTVTVSKAAGAITIAGLEFRVDGYALDGEALTLGTDGATLRVGNGTAAGADFRATINGVLEGGGKLSKTDLGELVLTASNSYSGGTSVAAGTLVGHAGAFGTGNASIADGATMVFDQAGAGAFAAAISGGGSLVKRGAGTLLLSGSSDLSGPTRVTAGRLDVTGTLAGSPVTVAGGGTLGGTGAVGAVDLLAGSRIAPGLSIGTLTVDGNIAFGTGSVYQVELTSTGMADRIVASGTAAIAPGAGLQVVKLDAPSFQLGTRYTVLTAAGGRSGTFTLSGPLKVSQFISVVGEYDASNAYLAVRQTSAFNAGGGTPNQMAAASGVDNAGNGQVYRAIAYLPNADAARAAFDLVSGEIHASVRGATFEDSRFVREAVGVRANATPDTRSSFWMHGYGAWGTFDGDGNAATLDRNIGGVFFGADLRASDNLILGILGGYGEADIRLDARASSASTKDFHLGAYLAYGSAGAIQGEAEANGLGIRAGIANMWRDVSTRRNVSIPGYVDTLSASYDIGVFQLWGDVGWRFDLGAIGIEPFGSMAFVKLGDSDVLERGGSGALRASDGGDSQYWTSLLGGRAYLGLPAGGGRFGVTATAAWQHVGGDTDQPLGMAFGAGPAFDISGVPIAGNAAALGLSLTSKIGSRVEVDVGYSGRIGSTVSDHGVRGSALIRF